MIDTSHLSKQIRRREVLHDITLHISSGTIAGLSGPNGSGKTMLMRMVVGLMRPTSGSVRVNRCDPWAHTAGLSPKHSPTTSEWGKEGHGIQVKPQGTWPTIGLLLEGPAFLDNRTGYENLKILADVKGLHSDSAIQEALESVGLDSGDRRRYRAYSLGMRQRLGIAGAILGNPQILILDEPTNALDDIGVELVVNLVQRAAERGAAVMLACHDSNVLRTLSHEIWHMNEGRIARHERLTDAAQPRCRTHSQECEAR